MAAQNLGQKVISKTENRIFVLGNSGSGKSWLSGVLADRLNLSPLALDEICWEPGGFYKRRVESDVVSDLQEFSKKKNWIVEGVYGNLVEVLAQRLTGLIWLDLDAKFCAESVQNRGFENIPWMDSEIKIQGYLDHIRSYSRGLGPMSRQKHLQVYQTYQGSKHFFKTRDEVNKFVDVTGVQ